jgi:ubiquinone/menaquinone biosynthesis C-methylase UbiE
MASKQYFDSIAKQWDEMRNIFFSEELRDRALTVAGVRPGEVAADIGAGTGFISEGLIQKGLKVIAVDQSEVMLEELKSRLKSKTIDCRIGNADKLPIESNHLNYVFANMYLHHVETPSNAIKEMVRILKPGGKIVITDLDKHSHDYLIKEHHDRWMGFKRDDIKKWFLEAGLKNITVNCAGGNCSCAINNCCSADKISINIFIASGQK